MMRPVAATIALKLSSWHWQVVEALASARLPCEGEHIVNWLAHHSHTADDGDERVIGSVVGYACLISQQWRSSPGHYFPARFGSTNS